MELISSNTKINFMGMRYVAVAISLSLIVFSIFVWFDRGDEKYSVDFVGGTEVVVRFEKPIDIGQVRAALKEVGLGKAVVQAFEEGTNDFSIRLKSDAGSGTGKKIRETLGALEGNSVELRKEDFVGPVIGEQIRKNGIQAMVLALICILLYISFRFEWRFAVGAIAALVHDVVITSGLFVFSGHEISAAVLAALLTIIGYSLNDTIIVFDRVRENFALALKGDKKRDKKSKDSGLIVFFDLVNKSINQTLSRTVLTSVTTLFVVTTLWVMGGGAVADLAFALVIGVIVGTYSSIFVACTTVLELDRFSTKSD